MGWGGIGEWQVFPRTHLSPSHILYLPCLPPTPLNDLHTHITETVVLYLIRQIKPFTCKSIQEPMTYMNNYTRYSLCWVCEAVQSMVNYITSTVKLSYIWTVLELSCEAVGEFCHANNHATTCDFVLYTLYNQSWFALYEIMFLKT